MFVANAAEQQECTVCVSLSSGLVVTIAMWRLINELLLNSKTAFYLDLVSFSF